MLKSQIKDCSRSRCVAEARSNVVADASGCVKARLMIGSKALRRESNKSDAMRLFLELDSSERLATEDHD